ncbi:hypothetical protein LEP1GSC167_3844 [Leptospira interrogans serovar Copenhageni str. HAI0188]|nr:hypothetical protein LEP1GSC167_1018 [Leptospira interrogans serovar Copenhageni str. HAI0188]EMO17848.1 hypothetical protein LEP1GSC167_0696 [Leptospira interrogans serovar Copenhageni str. HAI0188]EMO18265.1 hypothetical protein LEP1GSC167_3844 [Leptospira interrogans serovar Copenhageni str. HAI0188]QIP65931.1 hypothetical protein LICSK_18500 [Leptospira interrogans serovar Copenhageni]
MDRRSGLKKAHFSSVPTRMSLFTCKKYVFLIEKNFPNLTTPPKNRENSAHALYESRCGLVMLQIGLHLTIYKLSNSSNLVKFS